jgi:putative ABC transport system substrate-binding protein
MSAKVLSLALLLAGLLIGCEPQTVKTKIGYVQITQDPVLDTARSGVLKALRDSGYIDGENIRFLDNNAQGDLSMIHTILQSLISQNCDMIITNSTPCMVAAAQTVRDIPVVFTVAFGPEQVGMETVPGNLYGVFDPYKADSIVDLIIECLPQLQRVGIPYNNAEPNAEYSSGRLKDEFARRGLTVLTAAVNSANDIMQAAQSLAAQDIDAFIISADNTVYLGVGVIAKIAATEKIPLFVTDPMQSAKGAAVGFGVDYHQWGYQSGLKALDLLKDRSSGKQNIEPINRYQLVVNLEACKEQGLTVPESVLKRAYRVIGQ